MKDSWSRIGGMSSTYYEIAESSYTQFHHDKENRLPKPHPDSNPTDFLEQERRMTINGVKTIVFAAMCIESAAFDFAAIQLGDSYTKNHLDKLDIVSKWIIIPKLISGESLEANGPAIQALRKLVRSRNRLVHNKSRPFYPTQSVPSRLAQSQNEFESAVYDAIKTVVLLSLELSKLLGGYYSTLPLFDKCGTPKSKRLSCVENIIERCRITLSS